MSNTSLLLMLAGVLALGASASGRGSLPVYKCPKVAVAPVIDGKLDDACWKSAPAVTFVIAQTGEPATKDTKARMCWDDEHLYIAYECTDTDIRGTMTQHDEWIFREEVVEAFINPTRDLRNYFEVNISPRNVIFDAKIDNPDGIGDRSSITYDWTCEGLKSAVCVDGTIEDGSDVDRGWTVEVAIPFAAFERKTPKPEERWRMNLYRIDRSPEPVEFQAWSPTLFKPVRFHVPGRFGTLMFCES